MPELEPKLSLTGDQGAVFTSEDMSEGKIRVTMPHAWKSLTPQTLLSRFASEVTQLTEYLAVERVLWIIPSDEKLDFEIVFQD